MKNQPASRIVDNRPSCGRSTDGHYKIAIVSVTGDRVDFDPQELMGLLFHRVVLVFGCFVGLLFSVIDVRTSARALPVWGEAVHQVGMMLMCLAVVAAGIKIKTRLTKSENLTVSSLQISLPLSIVSISMSETIIALMHGPALPHWFDIAVLVFFMAACIEVMIAIAVFAVAPIALADLRARAGRGKKQLIRVVDAEIDPAKLMSARLIGEQVVLATSDGPRVIGANFGRVLADLPDDLGIQVHRTCWVAAAGVAGFYRQGREIFVVLQNTNVVRVAQSRQSAALEWLERVSARLPAPVEEADPDTKFLAVAPRDGRAA